MFNLIVKAVLCSCCCLKMSLMWMQRALM